ncbi:DUF4105 domain-containing protein [Psychrobacter urativorans]|uniref:Lnb N-terminal periplasmic domain-containing protein n=1 Tax=Psychrobacter urativorans TaxID=45610 RepID=A0A0M4TUY1_9GAMM|nr:DUF4105 domain-containing protein [Psychrobacter urativorans]ALF59561.1 hypothetical protein AOC03_05430 [Psychrobacter urativorans]
MFPRSFFSRLLSTRTNSHNIAIRHKNGSCQHHKWRHYIVQFFIALALVLSAVWLLMAIWYQFGAHATVTWLTTIVIVSLLTALLSVRYLPKRVTNAIFNKSFTSKPPLTKNLTHNHTVDKNTGDKNTIINKATKWLARLYIGVWVIGLGWFISIAPQQLRDWKPEVGERLSYTRDANNSDLVTFNNVRNFDWHSGDDATERWETRTVDMSKLSGVDVINSYWMGPLIAHTLVSFRFEDDRPLSFSLEIRKENGESFSALGGFFKRYELSLIAAEERDIIYTRSNARGEQVYLFPVSHLQQREVKSLFESYLTAADELNAEPAWYNTLTSNCTNIIFYMARVVSGERLPWDYRIWVSGWLPNYLYDLGMLDASPQNNTQSANNAQSWSMDTWYERAHINPKVKGFNNSNNIHGSEFSMQIRQGIPIPPLADRHAIRVNPN